jgi:hypothetical protein
MKNRPLKQAGLLLALILALCSFQQAAFGATTTTLFSEDFSQAAFPPTTSYQGTSGTWTSNLFNSTYGWYRQACGANGVDGSAMMGSNNMYAYGYNNIYLQSPAINASAYTTAADSMFVDFDAWLPQNYYSYSYSSCCGYYAIMSVFAGSDLLVKFDDWKNYTWQTFSYGYYSSSCGYYGASYWRHYHVAIPSADRSSAMNLKFLCTSGGGYYPDNMAIDNVVVTNTRYTSATSAPTSLNFGNLGVGLTSGAQYVTINNPNATPITVSNLQLGGTSPGDYSIVRTVTTIPAGGKDSVGVVFSPTSKGLRQANLTFNLNVDIGSSYSVDIRGNGLVPVIALQSPLQPFRGTRTRFRALRTFSFLVKNTGGTPLNISPTSYIGGDYPGEYTIVRLPSAPIAPGSSDTIILSYSPTMEGSHPAILYINSNADNGQQAVVLYGVGILPRLVVSPSPLNFDSVGIGQAPVCQQVTLYNPGSDTIFLTRNYFSSADADFTMTPLTGTDTIIAPDKSKQINVCFAPIRNGSRQARLRFTTNIPLTFDAPGRDTSSFTINVLGQGVPFGRLSIGGSAIVDSAIVGKQICKTDTFYNKGSAPVTITGTTITGADSADYSMSGVTLPATVQPGQFQVFSLCATPAQRGDRTASLNVTGTSNGRPVTAILPLDIFGQLACASATPATAFTSKTCVGRSDTAFVKVSNCGDVSSAYTAALPQGTTTYAVVGSMTSGVVGANGSATFPVVFTPTDRSSQNVTLTITGNNGVSQTVTLTGSGQAATAAGNGSVDSTVIGESKNVNLKINNTGECDWNPGTPSFSDPQFTYVSGSANIPAGQSGTLVVKFTPTAKGLQTATLSFPTAIGTSIPAANVTISGFGAGKSGVAHLTEANGYSLAQNYPNPFNPTTEIRFVVAKEGNVTMNIIDVTGKVVRSVFNNEHMTAGQHSTVVNASELASGAYYYQLVAGNTVLTRQMVLAK